MALSFASAGTDRVVTGLTSNASTRTYSIWAYRLTGAGGGGFGRMWSKHTAAQTDQFYDRDSDGVYAFERAWSTSTGGQALWHFTRPSANAWHHLAITYDSSSTANDPIIYLNGTSQTITEVAAPSGTLTSNSDAFTVGNRNSTANRAWNGYLAEFAVWDRILTADEIAVLADAYSPLHLSRSLVEYVPLINTTARTYETTAPTITGATAIAHPRIIMPGTRSFFAPAAAASAAGPLIGGKLIGRGILGGRLVA